MNSIYAVFAIAATLICTFLALFVYFTNRKGALNRVFIFAIAFGAYTAFTTFMVIQAENPQTAYFWNKTGFLWPFYLASILHFALVFTKNRLTHKCRFLLLYGPALLFSLLELTTDQISGLPQNTVYGYIFSGSDTPFAFVVSLWSASISLISVALCLRYHLKTTDSNKKQQALLVTIALAYPIIANVLSEAAYSVFGWYIPYYGVGANAILCVFIVYAIWRYDLFNLNPAIAAENIIATMPDSFVLTDSKGQIIRINPALTNLIGYEEEELAGKGIEKLLEEKQNAEYLHNIGHIQEIKNHETVILAKNGFSTPVSISSSLIKNKKGKSIVITLIIHDLTRRKQDEEKIVRNERFAAIGELAGMVSHDLRNPLSSMQAATYYLKKKSENMDETSKEMLQAIESSIQYSNKIVSDLLDYSREITLELEETNAKNLTENALAIVAVPQNIKVNNLTQNEPAVSVDKVKIIRVFVNIIKNAFEAMPNGGIFTISSTKVENGVEFSFIDTGTGMSKETIEKLWRPLFTTKTKGMGFGLPICKRIVEAHGGKIQVKSGLDEGSVFIVSLPRDN